MRLCFEFLGSSQSTSPWPFLYPNRGFCTQYMRLNRGQILLQSHVLNRHQPSLPLHSSSRIACQVVPLLQRPFFSTVIESFGSAGQDCKQCCQEKNIVLQSLSASPGLGCAAEVQVLCLRKMNAETFSGLLSQKRESNS